MRARRGAANPTLSLEPAEAGLIVHLAAQVSALLQPDRATDEAGAAPEALADDAALTDWVPDADVPTPTDPALLRLLPDAYADDESSREFRRFTSGDLSAQKIASLDRVMADIRFTQRGTRHGGIELTPETLGAWLRALTDLRLVLASRLGMDADGGVPLDAAAGVQGVYDWLGFLQESILDVAA